MRFVSAAVCATALAVSLSLAGTASAQGKGFALNRFDPSERGSQWFVLDSLDLRGHLRPAVGLVGDWGYKPLVIYDARGEEKSAIVEHQVFAHLGGSLVLWDRVRTGLNIPIALYQTGDAPVASGFKDPGTSFGDIRVSADVRLLGEHGAIFNSAIGFALYLPTGSRAEFTGDDNTRFSPRVSVAGDIGIFTYAGRLGLNYRPLTEKLDRSSLGSELTIAASAGIRLGEKKQLLLGPELFGSTVTDAFFEKQATPLEWLIGGHYTAGDLRFGAGMGTGLTRGWGTPIVRTVLSAEWTPGVDKDSDGDHIMDREDACPTVPGVRTTNPRTNGCPAPVAPQKSDRDSDGIIDDNDACPDIPGVASVDPAKNGCPPDRDGDTIFDKDDACPDVAGVRSDNREKNGCPPDRDGDTIVDAEDACPDVAGVKDADPKKNGCPPDRDGDSILDSVDACPDDPGPADPDPRKNGCPLARIEGGQVRIKEQVKFKTGSADILRESDPLLTAVATVLKEHPELTKIRVEGHTDNRGAAGMNKNLSERRAAAVVKWLTTFGIDKSRLSAKGFGLEKPVDTNETDEGRTNNRRVEFHIEPVAPPAEKPAPAPKKP